MSVPSEEPSSTNVATASPNAWSRWEHVAAWAVVALAVVHLVFALRAVWPFTTDDAYITLRYARHLAAGEGIRWNIGEPPLEGYSNPFSLFVATAVILAGGDPVLVLKSIGVATVLMSPILAFFLARQFVAPLIAAFAALPIAAHFGTSYWAVSGLETPIYLAMSLGCLILWSSAQRHGLAIRRITALSALTGITCLVRPDALLLAFALGVAMALEALEAFRRDRRFVEAAKPLVVFASGILLTWGSYMIFRLAYFGQLLPNSVLCKAMWTGNSLVLVVDALPHGIPLAIGALLGLVGPRRNAFLPFLIFPLLTAISLIGADPIIGDYQRHFVAAFGVLGAGAAVGAGAIADLAARKVRRVWGLVLQLGVVAAACFWVVDGGFENRELLDLRARFYERRMVGRAALAEWIRENTNDRDLVLLGDAGIIPYETPNPYRDPFCLNEAALTSPPIAGNPVEYARFILEAERPKLLILNDTAMGRGALHGTSYELAKHPRFESDYRFLGRWRLDGGITYLLFKRQDDGNVTVRN